MLRRLAAHALGLLRRAPNCTFAGWVTLSFLVIAFAFARALNHNGVIFVVCGIGCTVLLSAVVTALSSGDLGIERRMPARVFAGAPFSVRLRIRNHSRWCPALSVSFRDALQTRGTDQVTAGPAVPCLAPGQEADLVYEARVHRRGVYPIDYALAATRFPFGLFESQRLVRSSGRIIVLPQIGRLRQRAERELALRRAQPLVRRVSQRQREEFHGLREYRPGDNPRHIHWRTSARAMTLMRRELQGDSAVDLTVMLDTYVGGPDAEVRRRHFERAVSCAATVLVEAAERGRPATLLYAGGRVAHSGNLPAAVRSLDRLAALGASKVDPGEVLERAAASSSTVLLLISLNGEAPGFRAVAARRGLKPLVWDVSGRSFGKYFRKR